MTFEIKDCHGKIHTFKGYAWFISGGNKLYIFHNAASYSKSQADRVYFNPAYINIHG